MAMKKAVARGKAKGAAPKRAPGKDKLVDALGEAGWLEADRALATALAEFAAAEDAAPPTGARALADALALAGQALALAARRRGLAAFGAVGETLAYDPTRHALDSVGAKPARVKLLARGVERDGVVIVKARAAAARIRKAGR